MAEGSSSVEIEALIESLTTAPKYTLGKRAKRKLTEAMEQKVRHHLSGRGAPLPVTEYADV